jgi:20S proteasome alpha/beta subunit
MRFPELQQHTRTARHLVDQTRIIPPKPFRLPDPRAKLLRRKALSIAVGVVYDQGIVFCADTKITTDIKLNESKIEFFTSSDRKCCMTFAITGHDLDYARSSAEACWEVVKNLDFSTATMETTQRTAEFGLAEFYKTNIMDHPDRASGVLEFKLLVGIWLRGETLLFENREIMLKPVRDYLCVGSGAYLANYLVRQYRKANLGAWSLADAALIASAAVDAAIEHDPQCGGENEILIVRNDGDVSNAYDTAVYPGMMVKDVQQETWKLLHDLAHVADKTEATDKLEEHFERVRQISKTFNYAIRPKT